MEGVSAWMGENPAGQRGKYALVLAWVGHADSGVDLKLPSYGGSLTSVPEDFQRASGKPFGAPVGAYPLPRRGMTRRLRRERWGCCPDGGSTFFRSERKYQRKPAARRLRRRPTSLCTAAKPRAALGLGYALHGFQPFLALVGLRSAGAERLDDPNLFGSSNSGLRAGTV